MNLFIFTIFVCFIVVKSDPTDRDFWRNLVQMRLKELEEEFPPLPPPTQPPLPPAPAPAPYYEEWKPVKTPMESSYDNKPWYEEKPLVKVPYASPQPYEPLLNLVDQLKQSNQSTLQNGDTELGKTLWDKAMCIAGSQYSHSSCLQNSLNLVEVFRKFFGIYKISMTFVFFYTLAMTESEREEILQTHNMWRMKVQPPAAEMPNLKWDRDLEVTATRWAAQCTGNHDEGDNRATSKFWWVGQNLCFSAWKQTWTECIDKWGELLVFFIINFIQRFKQFKQLPRDLTGSMEWVSCHLKMLAITPK